MPSEACVKIICPHCGQHIDVPFSMMNSVANCPSCGQPINIAAALSDQRVQMVAQGAPAVAAFCANCGAALQPSDEFCPNCGARQQSANDAQSAYYRQPDVNSNPVSFNGARRQMPTVTVYQSNGQIGEKWPWILALISHITLMIGWLYAPFFPLTMFLYRLICVRCDIKHLRKCGRDVNSVKWTWLGFLLPTPVYLFARAATFSHNYGPAIAYCILMALDVVVIVSVEMAHSGGYY